MNTPTRNTRATIAQETLQIIEQGHYALDGVPRIEIASKVAATVAGTKLYDGGTLPSSLQFTSLRPTRIDVTAETTFEAIARLNQDGTGRIAALNFASARNPGGGFLGGAQAQEEALTRSSALYPSLLAQPDYYTRNRTHRSALYLDLAIYSPDVVFFRDDSGDLLAKPVIASVITAPAPNAGAVAANEPARVSEIVPTLRRRAALVLAIARSESIDRLILGAWGCGVFRNEPKYVAEAFHALLAPNGAFDGVFQEVVFAIYDRTAEQRTMAAFTERFAGAGDR